MSITIAAKTWRVPVGGDGFRRSKPPNDTLPPTVPGSVTAVAISATAIRVSWAASTDSQSGVANYIVERSLNGVSGWAQVGTPAAVTFDDTSCAPATLYFYRVKSVDASPAVNVSAVSSSASATTLAGSVLAWTRLAPNYTPIIPGLAGYGMDTPAGSGQHLSTPATDVMIVDTLSNVRTTGTKIQSNPNVWRCSAPFALRATFPRTVVFETSGVIDLQRSENVIGQFMTFAGQTAPSPGIFVKNGSLFSKAGDHLFWHYQNYNGDQASGQASDQRRGLSIGIAGAQNWVVAFCSMLWTSDQAIDTSVGGSNFTICHSVFAEPLCNSIHPKGPHGFATLFDATTDNVAFFRNFIAHSMDRNPLCLAKHAYLGNNITYNAKGDAAISFGSYGCNLQNVNGINSQTNVEGNWFIKGPDYSSQYGGTKPIYLHGSGITALVPGSKAYIASNHASGWPYTQQSDLYTAASGLPGDFIAPARIASAFPPAMVLENPQAAGYFALFAATVGARCSERAAGRDAAVFAHAANMLASTTPIGGCINTPGAYLSITPTSRDLFSSVAMAGDPMPNGADRDARQDSGYSKLQEWLNRMDLRVRPAL